MFSTATFHTVIQPSESPIEFSNSLPEDNTCAKTFWQAIELNPPFESNLLSADVKQRLRAAPHTGTTRSQAQKQEETSYQNKTEEFLQKSQQRILKDERIKIVQQIRFRENELSKMKIKKSTREN
ncbi:unnamed protein product [Dimorphilus gyrociliatus]|uniref:Cilia- and flagella-associated protein HOATZ n=1 Tax=Dimorphilus gyrociliatus TaxID=2664684 RepID=A0A7I8VWP9_9ANNE|nr:unnamed protein product [Dimorphilus gyrociliatus]